MRCVSGGREQGHFRGASNATPHAVVRGNGVLLRRQLEGRIDHMAVAARWAVGEKQRQETRGTSCPKSRGILPRRFIAFGPIPE